MRRSRGSTHDRVIPVRLWRLSCVLLSAAGGSLAAILLQRSNTASLDWPTTFGGGLVGLAAGLVCAGIGQHRNPTFTSEADVVHALSLPVLSTIPEMAPGAHTRQARPGSRTRVRLLLVSLAALVLWHLQF